MGDLASDTRQGSIGASGVTHSLSYATANHSAKAPSSNPFPSVTYRHLLSAGSLHPSNPLRVVAHCDVDAAYAQFEASRLKIDSFAVPVAVQQWQGLIAIGYKAREYGIDRHCDIAKARKLCPDLIAVHVQTIAPGASEAAYNPNPRPQTHKVSLDPYRRESRKILAVFKSTCPLGQVEKASIDESYFDLTLEVRKLLLERYPYLKQVPAKGMDEPLPTPPLVEWTDESGELMPVRRLDEYGRYADENEEGMVPSQEHQLLEPTWTDVALAHGAILMAKVRKAVYDELGYTTSAGIASNKTLAKLCSGYRKPNRQTTLLPRAVPAFLRDLPLAKVRFLGGKLGREVGEMYDASTVGDLWGITLESMQAHFGPEASWVHAVLRGIDHSPVSARIANKTMLASKNLRPSIRKPHEALTWLDTLSTELVTRIREIWEDEQAAEMDGWGNASLIGHKVNNKQNMELIPTIWPKVLVLRFIRGRGEGPRSRQAPFPFVSNLRSEDVYKLAEKLWYEACEEIGLGMKSTSGSAMSDSAPTEIVTISLGFSGIERAETGQKTIEGFFTHKRKRTEQTERDSEASSNLATSSNQRSQVHWICTECGENIEIPVDEETNAPLDRGACLAEANDRLAIQVQDHRDWHFAVRLSMQDDQQEQHTQSPRSPPPIKRSKAPKKGSLQSFFAKQTHH